MQQTCRRIYIERCADDNEYIRLLYISDSCLNLRHRLSEPDNKRTQLSSVTGLISHFYFILFRLQFLYIMRVIRVSAGADLCQLTMQVNDMAASCPFVQIIYILGDNRHIEILFQLRQQFMSAIRLHFQQLFPSFIIEVNHQCRITLVSFGSSYLLHRIFIPQTARIAKCTDSTLGTHARTCQYYQILHNRSSLLFKDIQM